MTAARAIKLTGPWPVTVESAHRAASDAIRAVSTSIAAGATIESAAGTAPGLYVVVQDTGEQETVPAFLPRF